jgi:hypothetical protein
MNNEKIANSLDKVLKRFGMETSAWSDIIPPFRCKLKLLSKTNNYSKLLRALFASKDLSEFNSYVYEVLFAYDFESKNQSLTYEVKQLSDDKSSVDFCYEFDDIKIYIELRLVQQRNRISQSIDAQLTVQGSYQIELGAEDELDETIRLQNLILSKCQKPDGTPINFHKPTSNVINLISVNLSELHLTMVDKYDCWLTMYGDPSVPAFARRGIFGMWQHLPDKPSETEAQYFEKFRYFRETIHGVLFVRYVRDSGSLSKMFIDHELEYFAILNTNLLQERTSRLVTERLSSILKKWTSSKNNT